MRCDAMRCDAMRCGAMRCGAVRKGARRGRGTVRQDRRGRELEERRWRTTKRGRELMERGGEFQVAGGQDSRRSPTAQQPYEHGQPLVHHEHDPWHVADDERDGNRRRQRQAKAGEVSLHPRLVHERGARRGGRLLVACFVACFFLYLAHISSSLTLSLPSSFSPSFSPSLPPFLPPSLPQVKVQGNARRIQRIARGSGVDIQVSLVSLLCRRLFFSSPSS